VRVIPIFELLGYLVAGPPPRLTGDFSNEFKDFCSQCLRRVDKDRSSVKDLLVCVCVCACVWADVLVQMHPWMVRFSGEVVDVGAWVRSVMAQSASVPAVATSAPVHSSTSVTLVN
jgi:hypothetical protein